MILRYWQVIVVSLVLIIAARASDRASADQICQDARSSDVDITKMATSEKTKSDRLALILGEEDYAPGVGTLKNAANDARSMAANLLALGFAVTCLIDPTAEQIGRSALEVSRRTKAEDKVFVYYAGHGANIKGDDYIIPISVDHAMEADDLRQFSVPLEYLMQVLTRHAHQWTVLVLDACRKEIGIWSEKSRSIESSAKGFSGSASSNDLWVIYSTQKNSLANDGDETTKGGLFASIFSKEILERGYRLDKVMGITRQQMKEYSGKEPFPYFQEAYYSSASDEPGLMLAVPETLEEKARYALDMALEMKDNSGGCGFLRQFVLDYDNLSNNSEVIRDLLKQARAAIASCATDTASVDDPNAALSQVSFLSTPASKSRSWTSDDEMLSALQVESMQNRIAALLHSRRGVPIVGDGVRVRAHPAKGSQVLGLIYSDKVVTATCNLVACEHGWLSIDTPDGPGYLSAPAVAEAAIAESQRIPLESIGQPLDSKGYAMLSEIAARVIKAGNSVRVRVVGATQASVTDEVRADAFYVMAHTVDDLLGLGVRRDQIKAEYSTPLVDETSIEPYVQIDSLKPALAAAVLQ